jgi:hypothetical protein
MGDRGLSLACPLPLVALRGEECGAAALKSSTGALKSFLIYNGGLLFTKECLSCHSLYHMYEISSISTALEWIL